MRSYKKASSARGGMLVRTTTDTESLEFMEKSRRRQHPSAYEVEMKSESGDSTVQDRESIVLPDEGC